MIVPVKRLLPKPEQVVDDIMKLQLEDYQQAVETYSKCLTEHPGVCFVAQFGSFDAPGVSDIDLLVVSEDESYRAVREKSMEIALELRHGAYLFWHPVIVIPLSLVSASSVIHYFNNVRTLWGDNVNLGKLAKPAFPLSAISTIVWNSYFWATVLHLRHGSQSLRRLLLVLGNIVQSIAADYELLGQSDRSREAVDWGKETRKFILAATTGHRPTLAINSLEEALQRWLAVEWEVQRWWAQQVHRGIEYHSVILSVKHRTIVSFSQQETGIANKDLSLLRFLKKLSSRLNLSTTVTLPSFYLDVITAIQSAFGTQSRLRSFGKDAEVGALDSGAAFWGEAIKSYKRAVESVREFSGNIGDNELEMFGRFFPSPFNL